MSGPLRSLIAWWRARLARRIVLPAIAVTLLFLAALGFVAFRLGQRAVVEQVEAHNRQLAGQLGDEIAIFFQGQLDTLRLQGAAIQEISGPAAQGEALVRLRAEFPYVFNDLWLYDQGGRATLAVTGSLGEVLAGGASAPAAGMPNADALRAIAERIVVVSPVGFRPISAAPYVTATIPLARCLPDAPCEVTGALQAQIDLRSFWTRVDRAEIEAGAVSIVDQDGVVLAHPERRLVGQRVDQAALAPLFAGMQGAAVYKRDGETYLAAYAPVGQPLGWGVIVEQERNAALGLVGQIGLASAMATLLSALSLALLLTSLVRRSIRPVTALSEAAGRIAASGDLSERAALAVPRISTSAEIARLAESFDQMIAKLADAQSQLQGWNEELERRVAERTAQLQTLLEVARLSSGSLDRETVLRTLLEQIGRLVEYDGATIWLLDEAGARLEPAAGAGAGLPPRHLDLGGPGDLPWAILAGRVPHLVADTGHDEQWSAHFGPAPGDGSWLGLPLVVQERPIGLLAIYRGQPRAYGDEQAALLGALASQVAVSLSHARLYEDSVQRVERELQVARQIQQHLFPAQAPALAGLDFATFYRPARETTGDFYSFVAPQVLSADGGSPADAVDLFIGDVSGKSLPAALLMAMARTALYAAASFPAGEPAATMSRANAVLYGEMPPGSFVASTYARFDRRSGCLSLVNAAQPAPLLVRAGTATLLEGEGGHLPLGIVADPGYRTLGVDLQPGDLVIFYTDGVIEAFSPSRELFGFDRLAEAAAEAAAAPSAGGAMERLIGAAAAWMGEAPQSDDIAIVAVRVTSAWGSEG